MSNQDSALHAQAPLHDDIVLRAIIGPETETRSLQAVCFSRAFSFTIVKYRFKPTFYPMHALAVGTSPMSKAQRPCDNYWRVFTKPVLEVANAFQRMRLELAWMACFRLRPRDSAMMSLEVSGYAFSRGRNRPGTSIRLRPKWRNAAFRKMRGILLALVIVGCAPAVRAQEHVLPGDYVVLDGGVKPETASLSFQESCFGSNFRFGIVNRPNGSFLIEARRNGRPPRRPEGVAVVKNFLKGVRNVRFRGTKCLSADDIIISLSGLQSSPEKVIQMTQLFTIRF